MKDKFQEIIDRQVLPKIKNIFPNEAKCEINPRNENECVSVKFKILMPDDPTKPPEIKYRRIIIRFSIDFIEDYLDLENKSTEKLYDTVITRICTKLKDEYMQINNEISSKNEEPLNILINSRTLKLLKQE